MGAGAVAEVPAAWRDEKHTLPSAMVQLPEVGSPGPGKGQQSPPRGPDELWGSSVTCSDLRGRSTSRSMQDQLCLRGPLGDHLPTQMQ